ncbi:hypothetical protein TKK_0017829 [Trichogramma kaykai]
MRFTGTVTLANNRDVSSIYVAKYNGFVDSILERINRILREKYDPVTVKLASSSSGTPSSSGVKGSTKKRTTSSKKKKKTSSKRRKSSNSHSKNKSRVVEPRSIDRQEDVSSTTPSSPKEVTQQLEQIAASQISSTEASIGESSVAMQQSTRSVSSTKSSQWATTSSPAQAQASDRGTSPTKKRRPTKSGSKPSLKPTTTTKRPASSNSNKVVKKPIKTSSTSTKRTKSKAKATLYGLSSLKRSGDVSVNLASDHTTIRTKFNLGPLVLRVEKEFGRDERKEVRSATATTAEMSGRLSLRVYHGGAATLHSIRVLQPKQMRIESSDDHDRTREFVWERSARIAHLVSQKLSSATRSMLRPPPRQQQQQQRAASSFVAARAA